MDIVNPRNRAKEVLEIILLAKACELRNVIQANVNYSFDASQTQLFEEALRLLIRKPDREYSRLQFCCARFLWRDQGVRKQCCLLASRMPSRCTLIHGLACLA